MNRFNVLIVGCGFVGATVYKAFSNIDLNLFAYDKFADSCKLKREVPNANFVSSLDELDFVDLAVVCLPTPMDKKTGQCRIDYIEEFIESFRKIKAFANTEIVIKSTIPPGTTKMLNSKYGGKIFFNPEFLTEANAYNDFVNCPYQIIGIPDYKDPRCIIEANQSYIVKVYKNALEYSRDVDSSIRVPVIFGGENIHITDSTTAEMVKLTRNCYLATRLSFFNEIKQICDKLNVDFNVMKMYAGMDHRVGNHYNNVNESNPGWGLSCLPKDINDLIYVAEEIGVDPKVLRAAWQKNLEVRKFRDWEQMEKAVKDD